MYSKVVNVLSNAGTGDQNITFTPNTGDPDWTPKLALVQWNRACTATSTWLENQGYGIGFTDGTGSRSVATSSEDNAGSSDTAHVIRNDCLITTLNITGTVETQDSMATFSQWLTNGMRINWSDAPGAQFYLTILFLGGDDITNSYVGTLNMPTGAGTQDYTSANFQPDCVIFLASTSSATINTVEAVGSAIMIGAATDASNEMCQTSMSEDGRNTMDTWQAYSHAACILLQSGLLGTVYGVADYSTALATGFRLNWSDVDGVATGAVGYLAIKGGSFAVGNNTEPGSTGEQGITTNKDTKAVAIFGLDTGTADSAQVDCMWSGGFADNGINQFGHVYHDTDNVGTSIVVSALDAATHIYNNITANATVNSTTWDDYAHISAVSSTGFIVYWDNIGQARPYRYISFGDAGEAPPAGAAELLAPQSHANIHQMFDNRRPNILSTIFG